MKIAKLIIYVFILIVILIFVVQNVGQQMTLKFFSENYKVTIEMVVVMLITFASGLTIGFFLSGIQILHSKNKTYVLKKQYDKIKKELDYLRNKEIDDTKELES